MTIWPTRSLLLGAFLPLAVAVGLAVLAPRFAWEIPVVAQPVLLFFGFMISASFGFLAYLIWLGRDGFGRIGSSGGRSLLWIVGIGICARLVLVSGPAILEDDYFRYLWDGAVVAAGQDPYAHPPARFVVNNEVARLQVEFGIEPRPAPAGYAEIAEAGKPALLRANNPLLTTIYTPPNQVFFAIGHMISPWQPWGWKCVIFIAEALALAFMIGALKSLRLPAGLCLIYWWNPLVLKEFGNSMHMDALLMPVLSGVLWLAVLRRRKWMSIALSIGSAIKLWPLLLLPLFWPRSGKAAFWGIAAVGLALLLLLPQIVSLDAQAGLTAYAAEWQRNALLFPILQNILDPVWVGGARVLIAILLSGAALMLWGRVYDRPDKAIICAGYLVTFLCLLSPTGYPWYAIWILPFAVLFPRLQFLLLVAAAPFYYLRFYFEAHELSWQWHLLPPLLSAGPIWLALAIEGVRRLRNRMPDRAEAATPGA